ncbi:N-acetylmuramoyl-L-alanine amidase [Ancylobacter sp. G4_0304]|uniref:N-acetylmuramoyl-L-alanine amidase n=1 Tax=Ancylobacter sp. G4_0304 TaxID=3114289 RepID=UPI0039C5DD00
MDNREIQRALFALGYDLGPAGADGIIGQKTWLAIRRFQYDYGLVVDGDVGRHTEKALKEAITPALQARPEPDKSAMAGPSLEIAESLDDKLWLPPNAGQLILRTTARRIVEIIIHCAATPEGRDFSVADIRSWHKQRGFSDIGYHYVVYRDGRVLEGRPVGQVGAHVADHNTGTIGVCYIGGVSADGKIAKDTRTPAQRASLLWLVAQLKARHPTIRKVSGHNEYAAKACPSFDVRRDRLGSIIN